MWRYLLLFACVRVCESYPNGQVQSSCSDMIPRHGSATGQGTAAPYTLTTDKTSYKEGDTITVTLAAKSGSFKGFLLQARQVGGSNAVGSFSGTNSISQLLSCSGNSNSAVSQTSSSSKTQIQVTWTTQSALNSIEFIATVVQTEYVFWVGVKSAPITYNGNTVVTTSSGSTVVSAASGSTTSKQSSNISSTGCGISKTCMSQPSNCNPTTDSSCFFMSIAPTTVASELKYELTGPGSGYVSMGFSEDTEMGNDDIYICTKNSAGTIDLQHAFSTGTSKPNTIALGNVSLLSSSVNNGVISCSFTSRNSISTSRSSTASNTYYLFFANGPSSNGEILKHNNDPLVSNTKVDPFQVQQLEGEAKGLEPILKAHGCLMLIAWMTTGSVGMLIARFLKRASSTRCCGKDFWFVAHVLLMSLTVIATSIAFILVFAYEKKWSGGAHPVLGCLVMILSLIQPIASIFRCAPQDDRRFIFNWAHAINALAIKGLAVAAIFTGLLIVDSSESQWLQKVMGGYVAWEALLFLGQDFYHRSNEKDGNEADGGMSTGVILLIIFFLGNVAFLVALLVGIGKA